MEIRASFDVLSTVIDGYERRGLAVENVDATTDAPDGGVSATVDLAVDLGAVGRDGPIVADDVDATDGGLRLDCSARDLLSVPETTAGVAAARVVDAGLTAGGVVVTVELAVDPSDETPRDGQQRTDDGADAARREAADETSTDLAAVRDESLPPFEDVDYLRRLYGCCDTFAAMTRLFEMDVSAETLRRYMIEAGVHDPDTYDTDEDDEESDTDGATASEESDEPSALLADGLAVEGVDLPDGLTVTDVAEAVVDARTVYEVHRQLGVEQERTRELLRRLDLLDLVVHRIDAAPDPTSHEEVAARIRGRARGDA
ncbi:MAG: hypothetical protein A07HB70_00900 [uncultured archaeon A07HB70]|nr:MAG: hypothetical protein A07HB70_00900 [uncultured archaeon A07HB70]